MRMRSLLTFVFLLPVLLFGVHLQRVAGSMNQGNEDPYFEKRHAMVEQQIVARGVRDSLVLKAMKDVPRHRFVPKNIRPYAYYDEPLPIGHEQTISQPYIVAAMTESLGLRGGETVLEVGTGSGYQAAVLAEIAGAVYTIEIVKPLYERAKQTLAEEGYENIHCRFGDGYEGWPEAAPFDAIIITAAPPRIPEPLVEQLKEGGRMIVPVGTWYQELVLVTKTKKGIEKKRLIPVRFVPMTGQVQRKDD